MAPSYPTKQVGFADDRRRGPYESYRPQDRDRDRDCDRDNSRGGEKSLSRDYRDDRDRSHDHEKERDRPKTREALELQLNTSIPAGPRNSGAKSSPLHTRGSGSSTFRAPSTTSKTTSAPSPQPHSPTDRKAKNPKVQPLLNQVFEWEELKRKRTILSAERDRKKREIEERDRGMDNASSRNEYSSIFEAKQRLREHDMKELQNLEQRLKSYDEMYGDYLENIATAIYFTTIQTPSAAPSTQSLDSSALATFEKKMEANFDTKVAALEKTMEDKFDTKVAALEKTMEDKFAALEKTMEDKFDTKVITIKKKMEGKLNTKTAALESSLNQARNDINTLQEKVQELQSNLAEALTRISEEILGIENKTGALAAEWKDQHEQLQADNSKIQEEVNASVATLKHTVSKVSREVTRREAEVDVAVASIRATISTKASTSNLEDVKHDFSTELAELRKKAKNHEDQLGVLNSTKPPPFSFEDIQEQLQSLRREIATIEQLRKNVHSVEENAVKFARSIDVESLTRIVNEWDESGAFFKFPKQEDNIEHLQHEMNKLKGQAGRLVQEPTPPIPDDGLRKEIASLQDGDRQQTEEINKLRTTMKNNMDKLVTHVKGYLNKQMEPTAAFLDDLKGRIEQLESKGNGRSDEQPSQAENQYQAQGHADTMTKVMVDTRIKAMEDRLLALVAEEVKKEATIPCNTQLEGFRRELRDHNGRVERLSFEVGVVNSQIANIWGKPLWDQICVQVDQNYSGFVPRIETCVKRCAQLEEQVSKLADQVAGMSPKRPGSPLARPTSESAPKKPRLGPSPAASNSWWL